MLRPCCSVVGLSTGLGAVSNRIKSNRSRVRKDPFGIVGKAATVCCADANGRPVLGVVFVVAVVLRDCVVHCEYVCVCAQSVVFALLYAPCAPCRSFPSCVNALALFHVCECVCVVGFSMAETGNIQTESESAPHTHLSIGADFNTGQVLFPWCWGRVENKLKESKRARLPTKHKFIGSNSNSNGMSAQRMVTHHEHYV